MGDSSRKQTMQKLKISKRGFETFVFVTTCTSPVQRLDTKIEMDFFGGLVHVRHVQVVQMIKKKHAENVDQ